MDRTFQISADAARSLGIDVWRMRELSHENAYNRCGNVVIRDSDPLQFFEKFFAAMECGCTVWLASPDWGEARMAEMASIVNEAKMEQGSIMIPTGGTTGRLRFAVHTWDTLSASAVGFGEFFGESGGHKTLCVMPAYHVSGLMQAVRVATLGGRLVPGNAHDPREHLPKGFSPEGFFISLVPTQLSRLLDAGAADWLRGFRLILVGGAALDETLARRALMARLPLSPSYGMTETAAVICALRPEEFLAGIHGVGRPLPHVAISVGSDSRLHIHAKSLCRAMIPSGSVDLSDGLLTNDMGTIGSDGILCIKGRSDRVIVSGGQKIDPYEVEAAILATGIVRDAYVIGVKNPDWGEAAVALYAGANSGESVEEKLRESLRKALSPVHVPKKWVRLDEIPRNAAGKPDVAAIRTMAERP